MIDIMTESECRRTGVSQVCVTLRQRSSESSSGERLM